MLNINTEKNGAEMLISIDGRIDTSTAPQLEAEIKDKLDGVTMLVLDMGKVQYISSAGLRVLLSAQKTMMKQGKMVLRNVPQEVLDIFEVTGFSDILTIE